MILIFSIQNESKMELFHKFFVEKTYFSDLQLKTILNSTLRLLHIVELTSRTDTKEYSSRHFTITNLWLHIIKYKLFYYIFITPTFYISNNEPLNFENEYFTLIKQINDLISLCTTNTPHFELAQNHFFNINTESLLVQFNKFFVNQYTKLKAEHKKTEKDRIKPSLQKKIGKYLIMGSASAGKSSIIAQFFLNWDEKQLGNIRPTINKQINNFKDSMLDHNFNLIDLGGQVQYTEMHLKDPNLFTGLRNLIYVIDIQDTKKIDFTKSYLMETVEKLKDENERPFVSIFLHKYDPDIQGQLSANVQNWIDWIEKNLTPLNLDYTYYFTSIKDDSAREALARTLLLTLPYWFLALTIKDDLIIRSLNSLSPIISELREKKDNDDTEEINKELFQQSILFGFATTKIIIQKWINHLLNKDLEKKLEKLPNGMNDISIEFDQISSLIKMNFTCPLLLEKNYNDFVNYPSVCEITHGIISGLSQFIGLGTVQMKETQIRDKSEFCKFFISI